MVLELIVTETIVVCIFIIGWYLHLKIIRLSFKEKEMTWKLDATNSCLVLFHYTHVIFMDIITFIIPNLSLNVGKWFCYLSKVVMHYGNLYVVSHSMIVSLLKFTLIVHWRWAREFGNERIKEIMFWVNICHALVDMLFRVIIKPDFYLIYDAYHRIDRCLGDPNNNWGKDSNRTQIKAHTICTLLVEPKHEDYIAYTFYVIRSCACWFQIVVSYLLLWNFFEIINYCRIFSFMRK